MMLAVLQPTRVENLPGGQDSLLTFFRETGAPAKIVLAILFLFSLVSWIIIFAKFVRLRRLGRQSEKFVAFFRKSKRFSEVNAIASHSGDRSPSCGSHVSRNAAEQWPSGAGGFDRDG